MYRNIDGYKYRCLERYKYRCLERYKDRWNNRKFTYRYYKLLRKLSVLKEKPETGNYYD